MTLVTGAASGIGRETVLLCAAKGHAVALLDRDDRSLEAIAELARHHGAPKTTTAVCDVRDRAGMEHAFSRVERELGALTGVVAAAGVVTIGTLHDMDLDVWDTTLGINLGGVMHACRLGLQAFLRGGTRGAIVCIGSPFSIAVAPGGNTAYAVSKAGINALVRSVAVDYARHGIRVNAVLPGPTDTPLMWITVPDEAISDMRATLEGEVPLGRLARPEDPARAAIWLLSEDAEYVTGSLLVCDGGVLAKSSVSI